MAAPAFRSKGAYGTGTTSFVAAVPTGGSAPQTNDILIILMESSDSTTAAGTPDTPGGWDKIFENTRGSGATGVTTFTIFAKRAGASESDVTITGVGNHCSGAMFVFSGAVTTGTAWGVGTVNGADSGNGTITDVSTPEADCLVLLCVGVTRDANATNTFSSWTNGNLASLTEREDNVTNTGAGGGIGLAEGSFGGSGNTGDSTVTLSNNTLWQSVHVYLKPVPTASGTLAQPHFRIKSDDTTSLTADSGWAAALDTNANMDAEKPFRIRFEVEETASVTKNVAYKLQWRKNAGTWTDAAAPGFPIATSTPAVAYYPSAQYSDNTALTTNLLAGSSRTFVNGEAETANNTSSISLNNQHTEIEVCVMIRRFYDGKGKNVAGDDFEFRLVESGGTVFAGTYVIPSINLTIPAGLLAGVFVETPNQIGPLKDGNGNLYCIIEYAETDPNLMVIKSTDGGDTWLPIDETNAPTKIDLESFSMVLENDRLYMVHQNTNIWHYVFRVSTEGTNPDTWELIDESVTASVNATSQVCDIARRSDGSLVVFYSKLSTSDRLFYKIKSGGSWGTEQTLEAQAGSNWGGVACARGASDKIHISYGGTSGNRYHRSLDSSNNLSARELLTSDGGTLVSKTHGQLQPIYYDASGTEKILVMYMRNDNKMYARVITNDGSPEAEAQATLSFIFSKATSREPAARGGVSGTTHHIIYADEATADLFYDKTTAENTWGTDVEFLDAVTVDIISGSIFTHSVGNGGGTVFGFIYANGTNGYTGDVLYGEKALASGYTQSNSGGLTPSGVISKQGGKVSTGTLTTDGSINRLTDKSFSGALSSITGALTKLTSKAFSGALSSIIGTLDTARIYLITLAGDLTSSGLISKLIDKSPSGTVTSSGSISKSTNKTLVGEISSIVGAISKLTSKVFEGALSSIVGTLSFTKLFVRFLEGSITPSGILNNQTNKNLSGTTTTSGTLFKETSKLFSGALSTLVGTISKQTDKILSGNLSSIAGILTASRLAFLSIGGFITPSGNISKVTNKFFSGDISLIIGTFVKQSNKSFSGIFTSSGILAKTIDKFVNGTITSTGSLVKSTLKLLSGILTSAGDLAADLILGGTTFFQSLSGTLTSSGIVTKVTSKLFSGTITSTGSQSKLVDRILSGTLTSAGTLIGISNFIGRKIKIYLIGSRIKFLQFLGNIK